MTPHELTMTAAQAVPLDELIKMIEAAIASYRKDPTDANRVTLANCCHLMLYKQVIAERGYDVARDKIGKVIQAGKIIDMQKPENG